MSIERDQPDKIKFSICVSINSLSVMAADIFHYLDKSCSFVELILDLAPLANFNHLKERTGFSKWRTPLISVI